MSSFLPGLLFSPGLLHEPGLEQEHVIPARSAALEDGLGRDPVQPGGVDNFGLKPKNLLYCYL